MQKDNTRPTSLASSEERVDPRAAPRRFASGDPQSHHFGMSASRRSNDVFGPARNAIPKLSCPRFDGSNPRIWRDRCSDYFQLCNVPDSMWPIVASLCMDGIASSWLQVYKAQGGLGSWEQFMAAVEKKFCANDYRAALGELLELKQTGTVEEYVGAFEALQYQLTMLNMGLDEMFFITQFVKGLSADISAGVQAQVSDTMDRAVLLAKIQQQLLDKGKHKSSKFLGPAKAVNSVNKADAKPGQSSTLLWKERQVRNYRRNNNLCYYSGEAYTPAHAAKCSKRPKGQVIALMLNSLDMPLTEDVLEQLALEDELATEFCQLSLNVV